MVEKHQKFQEVVSIKDNYNYILNYFNIHVIFYLYLVLSFHIFGDSKIFGQYFIDNISFNFSLSILYKLYVSFVDNLFNIFIGIILI